MFDTLVHNLEGIADVGGQQFRVNVDERVVHPRLVPLEPIGCRHPEILVGVKVTQQLAHFVILGEGEREREGERGREREREGERGGEREREGERGREREREGERGRERGREG